MRCSSPPVHFETVRRRSSLEKKNVLGKGGNRDEHDVLLRNERPTATAPPTAPPTATATARHATHNPTKRRTYILLEQETTVFLLVGLVLFLLVNVVMYTVCWDERVEASLQQYDYDTTTTTTTTTSDNYLHPLPLIGEYSSSQDATAAAAAHPNDTSIDWLADKEPVLNILRQAGMDVTQLTNETLRQLPTWSKVTELYGTGPHIYGLDQCQTFRERTSNRSTPQYFALAGMFASGTNYIGHLLAANCKMTEHPGKEDAEPTNTNGIMDVPWGKHNPPSKEGSQKNTKIKNGLDTYLHHTLPVVTMRDPYVWMRSMCRQSYSLHWPHDRPGHCPNLLLAPAQVQYSKGFVTHHESLAHVWNDWYGTYVDANFEKILVRYEDMLFHAEETSQLLCQCFGGHTNPDKTFVHFMDTAKRYDSSSVHGPMEMRTGLMDAIIRYGTDRNRYSGMNKDDLLFANQTLRRDLMEHLHYLDPPQELMR